MKKILVLFALFWGFITPVCADVLPYYSNNINSNSIGVYQANNNIRIYQEPNENSKVVLELNWDSQSFSSSEVSASNLFVIYMPTRELAFLAVVDETEDWVQVVYNKNGIQKGWIKKDSDEFCFLPWRIFFNIYGRKYGLYYLKDAPELTKIIRGTCSDESKEIGKIVAPQAVNMLKVTGNWALISAFDVDKMQKTGWIRWRSDDGIIYLFPAIKK